MLTKCVLQLWGHSYDLNCKNTD